MELKKIAKYLIYAVVLGDMMDTNEYTVLKDIYNTYIFGRSLRTMIKDGDKVLELGCGKESLLVRSGQIKRLNVIGVDIFKPYVDLHTNDGLYKKCILADIAEVEFKKDEFDAVVCMDVLEHIDKDKVISSHLLHKMQVWGKNVIITTPNGSVPGIPSDNNEFQNHKSGWTVQELRDFGYQIRGASGWKALRKPDSQLIHIHPLIFWAGLSLLSTGLVYYLPNYAFHLLATYKRGKDV